MFDLHCQIILIVGFQHPTTTVILGWVL